MNIQVNKPVLYIEPNYMGSERADGFGINNSDIITYQMPLEDYCIYVDLRVEVYGRGMGTSTNPNRKTYVLQWRSKEDKSEVSFLGGTEIHLQGDSGDAVNYLTTNYTNTYLYDLKGGQTNELFGISSIDIKYNQYFVPEVTIQFIDVRGGDLFSASQRSHQAEKDGIGGYRDEDIADSFFNCFFMTPYPQFEIIIKGFYGEPVNYKLNCTGFKTTFDSQSGNFNATASFMGYAFSFLSDVSFNALMAAPYATCGGVEYWNSRAEQIEEDFFLFGQNGEKVRIPTLAEFLITLDNVQEKMASQLNTSPAVQKQSELEDKKASFSELISKNDAYISSWKQALPEEDGYIHIGGGNNDLIILKKEPVAEGKSWILKETERTKAIVDARIEVVECAKALGIPERYSVDFDITKIGTRKLLVYNREKKEYKQSGEVKKFSEASGHDMTGAVDETIKTNKEIKDGNYVDGYYIVNHAAEYSEDIAKKNEDVDTELNANSAAVETATADALTNILGFVPTIYNFCKIFFAHLETYVWLYYNTCTKIYSDPDSRTPSNLGMDSSAVMSDFKIRDGGDSTVPPFPQVSSEHQQTDAAIDESTNMDGTQTTSQTIIDNKDGTRTVIEEDWIGNISQNFEEINLIHGLLNGAKAVGDFMAKHQQSESGNTSQADETVARECCVRYPTVPGDTVLLSSDRFGPWGTVDMSDYSSFCGKVYIRMAQTLAYGGYATNAAIVGKIDARNFANKIKLEGVVSEKVNGDHSFEEFINIVTGSDENYLKNGKFAWEASSSSHYGIARRDGSSYTLCTRTENGDLVLPYEGLSFGEINSSLKPTNASPLVFSMPPEFTKFAMFSDFSLGGVSKAQNRNVFCIDTLYDAYSNYFSTRNELGDDEKAFLDGIAVGTEFSFEEYAKRYNSGKLGDFVVGAIDSVTNVKDNCKFKRMPSVKSSNLSPSDDGCVFCSKVYNRQNSNFSKAYVFLNSLLVFSENRKDDILADIVQTLTENKRRFNIVPKYHALLLGGEIYMASMGKSSFSGNLELWGGASNTGLRKEVVDTFVAFFENWAAGGFSDIDKAYGVAFKENFYSNDDDIDNGKINDYVINSEDFKAKYKIDGDIDYDGGTESLEIEFADSIDFKPLTSILIDPVMLVSCSSENRHGKTAQTSLGENVIKAYWDAFTEELKNAVPSDSSASSSQPPINGSNTDCEAPEDLKVALYHHCKIFFDKWLAGSSLDDFDTRWKLGTYFDKDDTRDGKFHFIDSFYNDVSNRVLVNPQIVMEDMMQSQSLDGYTLMSVLSDVLSKNRFMLFCIENFKNLLDDEMFQKSFRPVPYNQIQVKRQNSDIVAMYTYEPSSHLEEVDYNFPGDSFMLDNERMYPYAVSKKDLNFDYPLPAFGVTYGMQYQSFFTNIEVSMEKPMVTETSLKTQYLLAGAANDTTLTRQYVPYGQDLFSIYSNNAYTCDVTMMGCAWVQPLMYFCLTNVPMFRGSYLISKVTHRITPGKMETHFSGTRMANRATRLTTNWIKKGYMPDEFYQSHGFDRYGSGGNGESCRTVPSENGNYTVTSPQVTGSSGQITVETFKNLDWSIYKSYGAGSYTDFKSMVMSRTLSLSEIPQNFMSAMRNVSSRTSVPVGVFVAIGKSESGFKDAKPNKYGYGGYFGQKTNPHGYGHPLEEQANGVVNSYNAVKKSSYGASALDMIVLTYIYHHLPAVGTKYWRQTNGKIWSVDPAYIMENVKACWSKGSSVTYAEHLAVQLSAQYLAVQIARMPGMGNIEGSAQAVSSVPTSTQVCYPTASSPGGGEYGGASQGEVVNTPAVVGTVRQKIVQLCNEYTRLVPKNSGVFSGGRTNNQYIINWHKRAGQSLGPAGWCANFVYNILLEAGANDLANALKASGGHLSPPAYRKFMKLTTQPSPGDILILNAEGGKRDADGYRHIGFVIEVNGNKIVEIGGNQSKGVTRWSGTFNGSSARFGSDGRGSYGIYTSNY